MPLSIAPILIGPSSPLFPASLHDLPDVPEELYLLGDAGQLDSPTVSIVGTRDATFYGVRTARALATAFAKAGVSVISGMARGIDSAAHRAALEAGGRTVAVLGTGIDVPYPVGNTELHRILSERALVISEHAPGVRARPGAFPKRNRLIAALSPVTIVVEAGHRSGAQNTVEHARRLDRTVAAVPGPIDSPQSAGANQLIRDGVVAISSVADALTLVGVPSPKESAPAGLPPLEAAVWKSIGAGALSPDAIAEQCGATTRECLAAVTSLELAGRVECLISGEVRRR
jgi:DNA processing protein